jgi:tetratricopeptide (TPR) repeat protein/TolB-like protein
VIPEKQRAARELFCDALEQPPTERSQFVLEATAGDPEMRDEVFRLLEREGRLGNFMATLPPFKNAEVSELPPSFGDGQVIAGRYRIERRIKCGGMGEVYEVLDTRLGRRTALKTILPEIAGDASIMERFRREVLFASNVTHKNVCRVYDIGEHRDESGSSIAFLTMEFLPGETLKERLKRCGRLRPGTALPLIRQMADALQAAHDAGVIHRDFKPGNVMLVPNADGSERAVVTDFGLARSTSPEWSDLSLTRSGQALGTPEYMSPEQWIGSAIGPAADLYALGAVIYEMTHGTAVENTPGELSAEDSHWKAVVDRCLARDPADRPSSAVDVVRALEGEFVQPSGAVSAGRKKLAIGATVAALALFLALMAPRLRFEDRGAVQQTGTPASAASRRIAVLPVRAGRDLEIFAEGLTDAITGRLGQYGSRDKLFIVPASEVRREGVRDAAMARSRFSADYVIEPSAQTENQRVRLTLTLIDTAEMRQKEAAFVEGTLANALALQDAAVTRIATMLDVDVRPEFADELNRLSPVVPGAHELYLQARGYLQRNDTPSDVKSAIEVLEKAIHLNPKYAQAHAALGEAYWRRWERTGERTWADKALEQGKIAIKLQPSVAEGHTALGVMYSGMGEVALATGEFEQAMRADPRSVETRLAVGRARARAKDFDGAGEAFRKALELQPQDWRGYRELGLMYYEQSKFEDAIEQFKRVIALTPDNPGAYNNLGAFYGRAKNYAKAEEMLAKSLQLDPRWLGALTNMGKLLFDQRRFAEAETHWSEAVKVDKSSYRLWGNLAAVQARLGRTADAQASYLKAVKLLDERIAVNSKDAELYSYRAHFLTPLGRRREALSDLEKAGVDGRNAATLVRDADTLVELGLIRPAQDVLKKALDAGYSAEDARQNERLRPAIVGLELKGGKNVRR